MQALARDRSDPGRAPVDRTGGKALRSCAKGTSLRCTLLSILSRPLRCEESDIKDFDVHTDVRDPLLKARAITEMVRLACQARDELHPEILYEAMLALEDIIDAAFAGLTPLIEEDEQALQDALQRLMEGRA
jgi:hypothetical protein